MGKTFDPKCYELAGSFLSDEPGLNTEAARITLAAEIQECIESEIGLMRRHLREQERFERTGLHIEEAMTLDDDKPAAE